MDVTDASCTQFKTEFKAELARDVARLGCQDTAKTRINEDATRLLAEVTRILVVETALRSAKHASHVGSDTVEVDHVEKSILQLWTMSLFQCRTRWCAFAGSGSEDDQCGSGCLLVTSAFSSDDQEVILLGSYAGVLRIFRPHGPRDGEASALPTDLMLESQLGQPILQLAVGPFISASSEQQLAILSPHSLSVHTLQVALGESDLVSACSLQTIFERTLPEKLGSAWQLIAGRFGGGGSTGAGPLTLGVVTACGALAVYEREARTPLLLQLFNPEELPLPGPVTYCAAKDAFLVVTPSWQLHAHKYTSLVQAGRESRSPDWSVSLGDGALALEAVMPSSAGGGREPSMAGPELLVLGQRSLTCWQWAGTLRFARRLPAPPRCMIHHIADGSLMVLVASETLMLYRDGQLCWTSQPPFPPVVMTTTTLESVAGQLVLVSDSLEVQCCVLGTEPTLFKAPTPPLDPTSSENMQVELLETNAKLKAMSNVTGTTPQPELTVQLVMRAGGVVSRGLLRLGVVAPLSLVSVIVSTPPPVNVHPSAVSIPSLSNSVEIPLTFSVNPGPAPASLDLHVAVSFAQADGAPHVSQHVEHSAIPLNLVLSVSPNKDQHNNFKIAFDCTGDPAKVLKSLMPGSRLQLGSTMTLQDGTGRRVSFALTPDGTCQVWSADSAALVALIASSILTCPDLQPVIRATPDTVKWLIKAVDHHYTVCRARSELEREVENGGVWVRQIQLRLLSRYKDRSARALNGLDTLLYEALNDQRINSDKLIRAENDVEESSRELGSLLRMCCQLLGFIKHAPSAEKLIELHAALAIDNVNKHWIEVVTASLEYILIPSHEGVTSIGSLSDAQPARVKSLIAKTLVNLLQPPAD